VTLRDVQSDVGGCCTAAARRLRAALQRLVRSGTATAHNMIFRTDFLYDVLVNADPSVPLRYFGIDHIQEYGSDFAAAAARCCSSHLLPR
jgi:hypothetical protein